MILTDLERAVLEKLFDGEAPALATLREQLKRARVRRRENTGAGFFVEFDIDDDVPRINGKQRFQFGDVVAQIEGLSSGAGFVVFVADGRLDMLEGYSYGEPWPEHIDRFVLRYDPPERNLATLVPN